MNKLIDETEHPVYTVDCDPEMEKKKLGTYSVVEILQAVNTFLNTNTDMSKKKHGHYSMEEILKAVEALHEQN